MFSLPVVVCTIHYDRYFDSRVHGDRLTHSLYWLLNWYWGEPTLCLLSLPGAFFLSFTPPLFLSVFLHSATRWGAGTIRKAQNLLKQYSQHGLDGKKASNLTPLEGNQHLFHSVTRSLTFFVCLHEHCFWVRVLRRKTRPSKPS